jgi:hypothetical protein
MKKVFIFLVFIILASVYVNAQTPKAPNITPTEIDDKSGVSFGFNAGYDYDFNAYKMSNDADYTSVGSFYAINSHWNLGWDIGVMVTKRLRPRFEMKFVKMSYGFKWAPAYPSWTKTEVKLYNLDLNFRLDYLLVNSKKIQIFASPALKTEFVSKSYYKMFKTDGTTEGFQPSILQTEHPKSIAGAALAMIFKYNLNENLGLTFTPEYTEFFRDFQRGNGKPYERFSTNLGFEYNF